jgi:hypothetical protein
MKRIPTFLLAFLLTFALAACDSGDSDDGGNGGGNGNASGGITATVAGTALAFDSASATNDGSVFQATGIRDNNTTQLTVRVNDPETGAFSIAPNNARVGIIYREGTTPYQADGVLAAAGASGTVTISEIGDGDARGTFSGTLVNVTNPQETISVTNGTFDVTF